MTLRPPNERAYERVLLIGGPGTGKTRSWLDVAKFAQKTGSDAQFKVVDTDYAVDRMLAGDEFGQLTNVDHTPVDGWEEMQQAVDKYRKMMSPQDWLVVDMVSYAWEAVQNFYTEQVFGTDLASFFLAASQAAVKAGKHSAGSFEQNRDWGVINRLYTNFTSKLLRLQGHLLLTAPVDAVSERDDEAVKKMFGRYGVRPRGQKHTAHLAHTVLITTQLADGSYRLTTVKDRERPGLEGKEVKSFALTYLVGVAKWRP